MPAAAGRRRDRAAISRAACIRAFPIGFGYSLNGSRRYCVRSGQFSRSCSIAGDSINVPPLRQPITAFAFVSLCSCNCSGSPCCLAGAAIWQKNLSAGRKLLLTRSWPAGNYPPLIYRHKSCAGISRLRMRYGSRPATFAYCGQASKCRQRGAQTARAGWTIHREQHTMRERRGVRIMRNRRIALKASVPLLTGASSSADAACDSLSQGAPPPARWAIAAAQRRPVRQSPPSAPDSDELLREARAAIKRGDFPQAESLITDAEKLGVKYDPLTRRLVDTPDEAAQAAGRRRSKATAPRPASGSRPVAAACKAASGSIPRDPQPASPARHQSADVNIGRPGRCRTTASRGP